PRSRSFIAVPAKLKDSSSGCAKTPRIRATGRFCPLCARRIVGVERGKEQEERSMAVTSAPQTKRPWLKFYDQGVPHTLTYPDLALQTFLDRSAAEHPDVTATIFFNATLTYRELSDLADRFAAGLQSLGVKKADRVALVLPNSPQYVIAFYGALRAGAIVVPTNPLYTPREMSHQFNATDASVAVVLSRMYPVVKAIAAQTPTVRRVVIT